MIVLFAKVFVRFKIGFVITDDLLDPTCAIFSKCVGFNDIKLDICIHLAHILSTPCIHLAHILRTPCTHLGLKSLFSGGEWRRGHNLRSSCIGAMVDSYGHWIFIRNSQWRLHQVLCINNAILINTSLYIISSITRSSDQALHSSSSQGRLYSTGPEKLG